MESPSRIEVQVLKLGTAVVIRIESRKQYKILGKGLADRLLKKCVRIIFEDVNVLHKFS